MPGHLAARAPAPELQAGAALQCVFFHGPDRQPLPLSDPAAADGTMAWEPGLPVPFHGIAPRGLLAEPAHCAHWSRYAHCLFDDTPEDAPALQALRTQVRRLQVLSFQQSAAVAQRYLALHLPPTGLHLCELWAIKEGHTSSVWQVQVHSSAGTETFVLNVARDAAASLELARSAQNLQAIAARHPELPVAHVHDLAEVPLDYFGQPVSVTVTRNRWIAHALEVHQGRHRQSGEPTWVLVERFVTHPERPAEIAHLLGRVLQPSECAQLQADLDRFLTAAREVGPVEVDINDGDLVWDGQQAVVVALR